jgi:alanine racemase
VCRFVNEAGTMIGMSGGAAPATRAAWAEVDLDAFEANVRTMRDVAAPAALWAVVKADGYGHGAVECARAALTAGAEGLCVALVQEGVALRDAGIDDPILLLSEQPLEQASAVVAAGLTPTVYSTAQVAALVRAVDTGMRRVGCAPEDAVAIADAVASCAPALRLEGVATHLAVADEPQEPYTAEQLARLDAVLADLAAAGHRPVLVHAANSAATLAHPAARRSFVRAGIALYGISPGHGVDDRTGALAPVLSLKATVSFLKRVAAGDRISYGLRHTFEEATTVATLPLGYADGVPRRLSAVGGEVLIGGRRCPIVGVVTMDQLMVDVGDAPVEVGDEAVLLGCQGGERIRAEEWADRLDTIGYEIVCGISGRVERRHHRLRRPEP